MNKMSGNDEQVLLRLRSEVPNDLIRNKQKEPVVNCRHDGSDEFNSVSHRTITKHIIRSLLRDFRSNRSDKRLRGVKMVRKLLSRNQNPPVDELINCGMIPILVKCLAEFENSSLQFEAAWSIIIICSGTSLQTQKVVSEGAVPLLVRLIWSSTNPEVWDQAIWALGNIIADSPQLRDKVLLCNFVPKVMKFVKKTLPITFIRRISWAFSIVCENKEPPVAYEVLVELLPALNMLIIIDDVDVILDALDAILHIISSQYNINDIIQRFIDVGILSNLVSLLIHESTLVKLFTLSILGNMVTGTVEQNQVFLDTGAMQHFPALLSHSDEKVCQKTLWLLSNVTAGTEIHIQAFLDTRLLPKVVKHLTKGKFKMQLEAALIITNLTLNCTKEQLNHVIDAGVIEPLCALLSYEDNQVILAVLECLYNILEQSSPDVDALTDMIEECNGLAVIEKLQDSENDEIYKWSFHLIKTYFSEESD